MPIPNNPITRKETYLAAIAGQEVAVPAYPLTREEAYLDAIAKNGSGGASYEIKGAYDTEEELKTAHPTGEAGDAYLVGDPSHVYVWLTEENEWNDAGEFTAIEGPQGPKGDKGDKGDSGAPTVITYEQWQELTPEQQASGNYIVQDYPITEDVIANPTLEGNEDTLTGLQVGDTKYKIPFDEEGESVTGNPLSFTTDSEQTARSTLITFEPIQAGSGDPSPENVRAISGYEGITLTVANSDDPSAEEYVKATDISEPLPETLYGFVADVEKGEVTVTHKFITATSADTKSSSAKNNGFRIDSSHVIAPSTMNIISDKFKAVVNSSAYGTGSVVGISANSSTELFIWFGSESEINTLESANTWLASNPVQVCYELATPYTIKLAPHQVKLLQGSNVVTTNGTSIALTYRNGEIASLADVSAVAEALEEYVNSKPILIASSNYDGTKTLGQQFEELTPYIAALSNKINSFLKLGNNAFYPVFSASIGVQYSYVVVANSEVIIQTYRKSNSSGTIIIEKCTINANGTTFRDVTNDVSSLTLELYVR